MKGIARLARELTALQGSTLVLTHATADLDACACALVLARAINAEARTPDRPTGSAWRVLENYGRGILEYGGEKYDNLVLVDVSNADLLGGVDPHKFKKIIAIDHHYHNNHLKADYSHIEHERASCAEIVFDACNALGARLSPTERALLLSAVLHDSAFFKSANSQTLRTAAQMADGLDYAAVVAKATPNGEYGEIKAVQKAVAAAELVRYGRFTIGIAAAKAFELQSAAALVEMGCDYALAVDEEHGKMSCVKRVGAPGTAGKIMEKAGKAFGGSGGGHECAAGSHGQPKKTQKALETAKKEIMLLLGNNNL